MMGHQQPGTQNNSYTLWPGNPTVQSPQNGHATSRVETSRQMPHCQTSAVPHQAFSSQSKAGWNNKDHLIFKKYPHLMGILADSPAAVSYQNRAQNAQRQTPPTVKTPYCQQNTHAQLIQSVTFNGQQSITRQVKPNNGVKKYSQNETLPCPPYPTYIPTAALFPCNQTGYSSTLQTGRPAAVTQYCGKNVTQQRFTAPLRPKYSEAGTYQSHTAPTPQRGQTWYDSSMCKQAQQYSAQLNSALHNAREDTCSYRISSELRQKSTVNAQQQLPNHSEEATIIAGIAESLRKSYTAESNGHHPVKQSLAPCVFSTAEHGITDANKQRSGYVGDSSSNVFHHMQQPEATSLQRSETQFSFNSNDDMAGYVRQNQNSIHSRSVAVVQPLLQEYHEVVQKPNSSAMLVQLEDCCTKYTSGREQGSAPSTQQSGPLKALEADIPVGEDSCDFDLSSIPTTQWTAAKLKDLTVAMEKSQMESQDVTKKDSGERVIQMFWGKRLESLRSMLRTGWYRSLMTDNIAFMEHVASDTVILSQVEERHLKHLSNCHVLEHGEVYSEPPYKSSWLNINEQLDDIDKEFGLSWTARSLISTPEFDSQPEDFGETSPMSTHSPGDTSNEPCSQTELRAGDSGEDKQASSVEITSSQISSPSETDSAHPSDFYNFQIQVMTPEEANVIFEQIQREPSQSIDRQSRPENVTESSVEDELPNSGESVPESSLKDEPQDAGDESKDSKVERKKKTDLIDEFCCLASYIDYFGGEKTFMKCACEEKQGHRDGTEKTRDEETTAQKDQLSDHRMNDEENVDSQVPPADLHSDSQSSSTAQTDSEAEGPSCTESEIPNQICDHGIRMSDSDETCVQEQLESVGSGQPSTSDNTERECTQDTEEGCPPVSNGLETTSSLCGNLESINRKRKTLHTEEEFVSLFKKLKKHIKVNKDSQPASKGARRETVPVNAAERKPLHSDNKKTAEFVLFGSRQRREGDLTGDRQSNCEYTVSHVANQPPDVLSVSFSPKRETSVPTPEYSVKGWLYEKWRRSYLPTTMKLRKKQKTLQGYFLRTSPKNAPNPKTKDLPVCSGRTRKGNKRSLKRKKRRHLSESIKVGGMDVGKLSERERGVNRSHTSSPTNHVLKFNVLPDTFNLETTGGTSGRGNRSV